MNSKKCSALYNHTNIRAGNRIFPCCRFKKQIATFDGDLDNVLLSKEYSELRQRFDKEQIPECQKCWDEEDAGVESERQVFNKKWDENSREIKLRELWIGLDNICNLKCTMCNSDFSNQFDGKTITTKSLYNIPDIERMVFLGGEPLMNGRYFRLLERMNRGILHLTIITNGMFKVKNKWSELLKECKSVMFFISIDGYKDINDKTRVGSDWNIIEKNVADIEKEWPVTFNTVLHKNNLRGIFFDLGFSTNQINDPKKGMSFNSKGKLNMKMGLNYFSAGDAINKLDVNCLTQIFKFFGEEKKAKIISKKIIFERKRKYLNTEDLIMIIDKAYKGKRKKIHNATKVFQALRIFVNQEIGQLIHGLVNSFKILPVGGVIAVVTFHSLEDKIVKFFFKNYSEINNSSRYLPQKKNNLKLFNFSNKKTIFPTKKEIEINPSSRSAKLRYALKINHTEDFSDFIKKFNYLIKIENLYSDL